MTKSIIVIADTHIGSSVALCPPGQNLDDGGTYQLSKPQRYLWYKWQEFVETIQSIPAPRILVLNGDLVEGDDRGRSYQLITHNRATILRIAATVLEPVVSLCDALYVVRGTAAHASKSAQLEEELGRDLGAVQHPDTEAFSWWRLYLDVEDVRLDIAHHGRGLGISPTASAINYARQAELSALRRNRRPPNLVIRSHNHRWADSDENEYTRVIYTPCWSLPTEYAYRMGTLDLADIGALAVVCEDGRYEINRYIYTLVTEEYIRL